MSRLSRRACLFVCPKQQRRRRGRACRDVVRPCQTIQQQCCIAVNASRIASIPWSGRSTHAFAPSPQQVPRRLVYTVPEAQRASAQWPRVKPLPQQMETCVVSQNTRLDAPRARCQPGVRGSVSFGRSLITPNAMIPTRVFSAVVGQAARRGTQE